MKRSKLIYILCLCTLLTACNDFLNVQPKGEIVPSTYEDYNSLMGYTLMCKASESYLCQITDDVQLADGDLIANYASQDQVIKNLYSFAHGAIYNEGDEDNLWKTCYSRIYTFNTVINNIMNIADATEEKKKELRAQATLGRAYEYLTLVSIFSPLYKKLSAPTDYGVPLILSEDISNTSYIRNSVDEVYKLIKSDLEYSLQYLPNKMYTSFRPTKASAAGVLSRMYLRMEDYENALLYANLALNIKGEFIDMKKYTGRPKNGIPNDGIGIVLQEDMKTPYPEGDNNIENIYTRYQPVSFKNHQEIYASENLLDSFKEYLPEEAVDMRRFLYYRNDRWGTYQFVGYTMWGPRYQINVAITTTETALTAAECLVRKGDTESLAKASEIYNKLRDYRIKGNIHISFSEQLDALKRILNERRKEFAFVGEIRLIDLKRLNRDPRFSKLITHTADGVTWTLEPNDARYIFPLPPKIFGFKPNLIDYDR